MDIYQEYSRTKLRDGHEMATVHAEQKVLLIVLNEELVVVGATAYITHYPCVNCMKILCYRNKS